VRDVSFENDTIQQGIEQPQLAIENCEAFAVRWASRRAVSQRQPVFKFSVFKLKSQVFRHFYQNAFMIRTIRKGVQPQPK
jgi:hypothetical protein